MSKLTWYNADRHVTHLLTRRGWWHHIMVCFACRNSQICFVLDFIIWSYHIGFVTLVSLILQLQQQIEQILPYPIPPLVLQKTPNSNTNTFKWLKLSTISSNKDSRPWCNLFSCLLTLAAGSSSQVRIFAMIEFDAYVIHLGLERLCWICVL